MNVAGSAFGSRKDGGLLRVSGQILLATGLRPGSSTGPSSTKNETVPVSSANRVLHECALRLCLLILSHDGRQPTTS
jgi:hypothetical protein